MQVTETQVEGLRREFAVVIPATELDTRLTERLTAMKGEVQIKGFRPGKVPVSYLRRLVGRSEMATIVQSMLSEVARDTLASRGEKAVTQPDYKLPEDEALSEKVLTGSADLSYTMSYEVMPHVELADFKKIEVERPTLAVADEDIEEQIKQLAEGARSFATKQGVAATGDRLTISYVGKIDGETVRRRQRRQRGADDRRRPLHSRFDEQLIGLASGDSKTITVTFPADYAAKNLAGKEATFDVNVKALAAADPVRSTTSLPSASACRTSQRCATPSATRVKQQYTFAAGQKVKRNLLDILDKQHDFALPPALVDQEFETIWRQITDDLARSGKTFADEGTTEEAARADIARLPSVVCAWVWSCRR